MRSEPGHTTPTGYRVTARDRLAHWLAQQALKIGTRDYQRFVRGVYVWGTVAIEDFVRQHHEDEGSVVTSK